MNILIADDMQGWLDFHLQNLKIFLKNKNINFYSFLSAKEAYDFAFTFKDKINLVITDLEMEQMYDTPAGAWLINMLKNTNSTKDARYIIISGSSFIAKVAEDTDADAFLRKPTYHSNPDNLKFLLQEMFGENICRM